MGKSKSPQVSIIAAGPLLFEAIVAAKELKKSEIEVEVINSPTIKPLDERTIISSVKKSGAVVTVEEAQITGGLGGAVAELLSRNLPTPQEYIGMPDHFGESGEPDELLTKYHMKVKRHCRSSKESNCSEKLLIPKNLWTHSWRLGKITFWYFVQTFRPRVTINPKRCTIVF